MGTRQETPELLGNADRARNLDAVSKGDKKLGEHDENLQSLEGVADGARSR